MKEEYWELFMTSGKIDDYLNYKQPESRWKLRQKGTA